MKKLKQNLLLLLILLLFFVSLGFYFYPDEKLSFKGLDFIPLNTTAIYLYDSDFGDSKFTIDKKGNNYTWTFTGDDFHYVQDLIINEKGLFVKRTEQKIDVILWITKEGEYTYDRPLLRLPFPITIGEKWKWEGKQFNEDNLEQDVWVTGEVIGKETIEVPAGKFETVKVRTLLKTSGDTKNRITEWYSKNTGLVKMLIQIEGGGMMGFLRDLLGYGEIVFELQKIKK